MIWKCLYNVSSSRDHGTLGFFKSKLNRVTIKNDPKKDVNATVDFLMTVTKGHLLAAACTFLGVQSLTSPLQLPSGISKCSYSEQYAYVHGIATAVVEQCTLVDASFLGGEVDDQNDHIHNYAKVLCHFGSLLMEFMDGWAEGDSERVYRCWRLFLPHFKAFGRTKYSVEALRLQFQVSAVLSPQLAHQVMYDRFVNTRGGIGRNIPCDLYNEFVNKLLKHIISSMGSNLTEESLQRAARSVSMLQAICKKFDRESNVPIGTQGHSTKTDAQDVAKVTAVVMDKKLLNVEKGRAHKTFPEFKLNPLWKWDRDNTKEWIKRIRKV